MKKLILALALAISVVACTPLGIGSKGKICTKVPGECYYAAWDYDDSQIAIVWMNGVYYIHLHPGYALFDRSPVFVPFDEAERAISWIQSQYAKLTDIRKQMKENEVDNISKSITLEDPNLFYTTGYFNLCSSSDVTLRHIGHADIDISKNTYGYIRFYVYATEVKISDETYPVMMAALKNRYKMKKKLEPYVEEQLDMERRKLELENSIW